MNSDSKVTYALGKLPHHEHAVPVLILDTFLDHNDDGKRKAKIAFSQKFENGLLTDWLGRHNSSIGFGTDEFIVPSHCLLESVFPDDEGVTAGEKMKRGSVVGINEYHNLNGVQYEFRSVRGVELSSSLLLEKGILIPVKIQFTGIRTDQQMILGDKKIVAIVESDFRTNYEQMNAAQVWDGMLPEGNGAFEVQFSNLYHPRDVQRLESDAEKFSFVNAEVTTAQDGHRVAELFFAAITSGGSPADNPPKPDMATSAENKETKDAKTELPKIPTLMVIAATPTEEKKEALSKEAEKSSVTSPKSTDDSNNNNAVGVKADMKITMESEKKKAGGPIIVEDKGKTPKGSRNKGFCGRLWSILCCKCS